MHPDHRPYFHLTGKARLDKAIHTLVGLVEGIALDGVITSDELALLDGWLGSQQSVAKKHPFDELAVLLRQAVADGVFDAEERRDFLWLCDQLRSSEYFDEITADLQRLHAIAGALLSDGVVTETELMGLDEWLADHAHLERCWPYDALDALVRRVIADGVITGPERAELDGFLAEFLTTFRAKTLAKPAMHTGEGLEDLFATDPRIVFRGSRFCFTGASDRYTRSQATRVVESLGGGWGRWSRRSRTWCSARRATRAGRTRPTAARSSRRWR